MTEPTSSTITLGSAEVRRLISIAARWNLLSRLAGEVNAMCDARSEHLLLTTRDDTLLGVQKLISMVRTAAPELRDVDLDHAEAMSVTSLLFGQREAEIIADVARRAILASKLLGPLLAQLPESSRTWFDARKIVDRLGFDERDVLGYVRRINLDRVSEIFAAVQGAIQCRGIRGEIPTLPGLRQE